jgi:hypothetical protein
MEMLFDIKFENSIEGDNKFFKKINILFEDINYHEIKEDFYID